MQFKTLTISAALATTTFAVEEKRQEQQDIASVFRVLATALPSSLINEALTDPPAVSNEIASQFSAGETPSWFNDLPTNIQTYLVPLVTGDTAALSSVSEELTEALGTDVLATPTSTGDGMMNSANATARITSTPSLANATAIGNATEVRESQSDILSNVSSRASELNDQVSSEAATGGQTMTSTSTVTTEEGSEETAAGAEATASETDSDSAAMPTAMVGAGLAGAVGLVGLFAL